MVDQKNLQELIFLLVYKVRYSFSDIKKMPFYFFMSQKDQYINYKKEEKKNMDAEMAKIKRK